MAKDLLGKWNKKITRLDKMMVVDCVPKPFALAIGIAVAAFHVFWSIGGPECIDAAWDRAKRGRNLPPGQKPPFGGSHRGFKGRGFAVGPAIGPPPGGFGGTLIPLGNAAQLVGFGLALVDGFLDGVFYGASATRRYSGCANPGQAYAQMEAIDVVGALLPAGTFYMGFSLVGRNILLTSPVAIGFPPGFLGFLTVHADIQQQKDVFPGLPDCDFTWRVVSLPSGQPVRQNWAGLGWDMVGNSMMVGQDIFPVAGDSQLSIEVTKTFGVFFVKRADFTVHAGMFDANLAAYDCQVKTGTIL